MGLCLATKGMICRRENVIGVVEAQVEIEIEGETEITVDVDQYDIEIEVCDD